MQQAEGQMPAVSLRCVTRGVAKTRGSGPGAVRALRGVELELRELVVLLGASAGETISLFLGAQVRYGVRVIERGP
jgi:hypothetical protein